MSEQAEFIHAQPRQRIFLKHPADVVIFGGGAFGGKTFALLMEAARYVDNPRYQAVIFRLTYPMIFKAGGLWDSSKELYSGNAAPLLNPPRWEFPSGAKIAFEHLDDDKTMYGYKSAQIPMMMFDQLEEQEEHRWWYMFSRNRSTCGVPARIRATCNPDSQSWLAKFIEWWIDQETGYPNQDRIGKVRWMARDDDGDQIVWGNTAEEVRAKTRPDAMPKSVTFIPAKVEDNPIGTKKDPGYIANLQMQTRVERERLLGGNWKITPAAGLLFPRTAWNECEQFPADARLVRYVDKAYTEGGKGARTASVIVGELTRDGLRKYFIGDGRAGRWGDAEREKEIKEMARSDRENYGFRVPMRIEQEPAAGKFSARFTISNLAGYDVQARPARMKKHIAWQPLASQVQNESVWIVTGKAGPDGEYVRGAQPWCHEEFKRELDRLSGDPKLDARLLRDYCDAASGAFNELTEAGGVYLNRPLLCSGGDYEGGGDVNQPLTEDELTGLPDILADIMRGARRDTGGYGRD